MKKFKRALRLLGFVCLISLAMIGVGISGGIPIRNSGKREETIEIVAEEENQEEVEEMAKI